MFNLPMQQSDKQNTSNNGKYWGLWLPVTTFIGIINSLFWIWLLSRTVGLSEPKKSTRENRIIEQF